jgi:hypothetical protein
MGILDDKAFGGIDPELLSGHKEDIGPRLRPLDEVPGGDELKPVDESSVRQVALHPGNR